jgi:hypothetical protein
MSYTHPKTVKQFLIKECVLYTSKEGKTKYFSYKIVLTYSPKKHCTEKKYGRDIEFGRSFS